MQAQARGAKTVDADYLVVGAGAMGMAFTDALVAQADARVALVDRRHTAGGHWLDAYPFVRLHQASAFYGVASTLLGGGQLQEVGPEAGLQERATVSEICTYYGRVLARLEQTGKVEFFPGTEYAGDRTFSSRISGQRYRVPDRCRIVDARYLAPAIPANTPAPFAVGDGARVIPVNDLVRLDEAPGQYVVAGAGKTATDAIIWLLAQGVAPDAICWVRPRDPWMTNRAVVQPNPAIFLGMAADVMEAAIAASSPEDLFLRMEEAGIMLRIDRSVLPTMAKAPTLATWELDRLRTIENVVRLGHLQHVERGRITFAQGSVSIAADALLVHCAAPGLRYPPPIPVWAPDAITLRPVRAGFPCLGAALIGYVEATRDDDTEKNRLCPPSPYPDTMASWARMNAVGTRATMTLGAEPDIRDWLNSTAINPARIAPEDAGTPAVAEALGRLRTAMAPGVAALDRLAG